MGKQGPRPATSGDWLLVTGVMAMMLGLVIAGAGFVVPESSPDVRHPPTNSPTNSGLPLTLDSPPAVEHVMKSDPGCIPNDDRAAVAVSTGEDPREYLNRMAALPHHRAVTAATVGPYQASLDPALYSRPATPPIPVTDSFTAAPSQIC